MVHCLVFFHCLVFLPNLKKESLFANSSGVVFVGADFVLEGVQFGPLRDYFAEIEAAISAKLQTWQLQHLSLWTDFIEPPSVSVVIQDTEDIVAMEDAAQAAKFREVKAKIAQDCAAMGRFNAQAAASAKRLHVVEVLHEKGQIQVGKEFLDQKRNNIFCIKRLPHLKELKYRGNQQFRFVS